MLSTSVRKEPYYLKPLENLEDLLYYICGALKRDPVKSASGLALSVGTLEALFERTVKGTRIGEVLRIRKAWDPRAIEQVMCSLKYTEPREYEAACKEQMKKEGSSAHLFYRDFFKAKGKNRPLCYEMFVDSIHCMQWKGGKLSYETNNIGRGLRTLAKLKIVPEVTFVEGDATLFQALYDEMISRAAWPLGAVSSTERPRAALSAKAMR